MLSLYNPFWVVGSRSRKDRRTGLSSLDYLTDSLLKYPFDSAFGLESKKNEDGTLSVSLDVPGIKKEDISVEVSADNIVNVSGQRKTTTSSYSVNKSFYVPDGYDPDSLKAELKDGVLTLMLSIKPTESKSTKKIDIVSS